MYLFCLNENHCGKKKKLRLWKIISRYVSREKYRDISMHRWIVPPLSCSSQLINKNVCIYPFVDRVKTTGSGGCKMRDQATIKRLQMYRNFKPKRYDSKNLNLNVHRRPISVCIRNFCSQHVIFVISSWKFCVLLINQGTPVFVVMSLPQNHWAETL